MSAPNAYDYPDVYYDLGINLSRLGTVMLDVDPIPGISETMDISGCTPHRSADEEQFWIDGAVGEHAAHLTLLYGLLGRDKTLPRKVLADWKPEPIVIDRVEVFSFDGYACIVARAVMTPNLLEAHTRLSLLPHIDLFPDYKPHVTLAYVKGSEEQVSDLVKRLNGLNGQTFAPRGLNFG